MYIVFIYLYDRPSLIGIVQVLAKFNHFPLGFSRPSLTFLLSLSLLLSIYLYIFLFFIYRHIIRIRNFHLKAFSFNKIKTYVRIACMYIMCVYAFA